MATKKYSTFKQIESELEILKVEKELSFQQMRWDVQKIRESFAVPNMVSGFLAPYKLLLSNSFSTILQTAIPLIIKVLKKKRGT